MADQLRAFQRTNAAIGSLSKAYVTLFRQAVPRPQWSSAEILLARLQPRFLYKSYLRENEETRSLQAR